MLVAPLAVAQDAEKPLVAFLTFGPSINEVAEFGVIEALHRFGYLTEDEYGGLKANLEDGLSNLAGEKIDLLFSDASWDFSKLIPMMEAALD